MNRHHPTTCACGLPYLLYPDAGIQACGHCDTGDCAEILARAHPSMECVDCIRLGTNWDARMETP